MSWTFPAVNGVVDQQGWASCGPWGATSNVTTDPNQAAPSVLGGTGALVDTINFTGSGGDQMIWNPAGFLDLTNRTITAWVYVASTSQPLSLKLFANVGTGDWNESDMANVTAGTWFQMTLPPGGVGWDATSVNRIGLMIAGDNAGTSVVYLDDIVIQ
jgi:hypothetical protein